MKVLIEVVRRSWHADYVEMSEEEFKRVDAALSSGDRQTRQKAQEELAAKVPSTAGNWQDDEIEDSKCEPAEISR